MLALNRRSHRSGNLNRKKLIPLTLRYKNRRSRRTLTVIICREAIISLMKQESSRRWMREKPLARCTSPQSKCTKRKTKHNTHALSLSFTAATYNSTTHLNDNHGSIGSQYLPPSRCPFFLSRTYSPQGFESSTLFDTFGPSETRTSLALGRFYYLFFFFFFFFFLREPQDVSFSSSFGATVV